MAKPKKEETKEFMSYLLINKKHRVGANLVFTFVYFCFVILIGHQLMNQNHWTTSVVPVVLFSMPVVFFPLVENWEYKPWQAKAQKYERHYKD